MNIFEQAARAKKVTAMLLALPPVTTAKEALAQSAVLARFTQEQRDCWARQCRVASPSDLTWAELVQAARTRPTVDSNALRAARAS